MELPELEVVRRWLADHVVGRRVRALHTPAAPVGRVPCRCSGLEALEGQALDEVARSGRTLTLRFGTQALDLALSRSGAIYVGRPERDVPVHWRLAIEWDGHALWLIDRTGASRIALRPVHLAGVDAARTGIEPLSAAFTLAALKKVLAHKRRTMRRLLVDGQQIAGLGEAYADEILHASRVRPTRTVATLDEDEVRSVYYAIIEVLQKAIRFGGRSDAQCPFVEHQPGLFDRVLAVHRRKGLPCASCGTRIRVVAMAEANAFYCPRCQA